MITHLFFDAGGTLVFPNFTLIAGRLAARGSRVEPEALERCEPRARLLLDNPDVIRKSDDQSRWTMYFESMFRDCGVTDPTRIGAVLEDLREIHRRSNLWEIVPPAVPAALEALRLKYRLAVISNANGTVREKLRRVGLLPYFEAVLDSHEEGVEKPDPRLFRTALDRTGAQAKESLYVGDMYHIDVAGARAAGMEGVLLDPAGLHGDKPVRRITGLEALVSSIDGRE